MFTFFAPILSLFIFILGNGFFPTLLALKLNLTTASDIVIGSMSALFYAGLIVGAFYIEKMICRVGHIRAYAVFASLLAMMMMGCGITNDVILLLGLRFLSGIATAGVYVLIESWLLAEASPVIRGKVLALYMISFYLAHSFGHFFLNLAKANDLLLFVIVSMTCSLSVVPLALTKVDIPKPERLSSMRLRDLYYRVPAGLVGCLLAGLLMGSIFGMSPIFFSDFLKHKSDVAFFMFSVIFGGMLFQYPVGFWSDKANKQTVLSALSLLTLIIIWLTINFGEHYWLLWGLTCLLGGFIFSLYPVSISLVCDVVSPNDIVQATQSLLLMYSAGAMIGPFLASIVMHHMGPWGLYVFLSATTVMALPLFLWSSEKRRVRIDEMRLEDETLPAVDE